MISEHQFILDCQNKVFKEQSLVALEAEKLLNIPKSELKTLSNCANKITRKFQGDIIDVEQLSNIKKNYCSEDCSFCGQSAFFNTNVKDYQLLSKEEVVNQAKKSINEPAGTLSPRALQAEPSVPDSGTGSIGQRPIIPCPSDRRIRRLACRPRSSEPGLSKTFDKGWQRA